MSTLLCLLTAAILSVSVLQEEASAQITNPVRVESGLLSGVAGLDPSVRIFKGIPYSAPPVGGLRWKAPQPMKIWEGVRRANAFGPRAMQLTLSSNMVFRSHGMSEDCLYLNIWTSAKSDRERLPVLVYFYGGGFAAGDGSEPRYDGESMAQKGIVAVTVNYRLGLFGFLALPELTAESPHHASGNYGLLDQSAALQWVHRNIASFGGDPKRITVAGESAGSFCVSAQMASPLSKKLISGAIGESGALLGPAFKAVPLAEAEKAGAAFMSEVGAGSLADLRAMPAQQLLNAMQSYPYRFCITIDGYFLPEPVVDIYAAGKQAHVPLLVGWNAEEINAGAVLAGEPATVEGFARAVRALYGDRAAEALKVYPVSNDTEAKQAATDLASDRSIAYGTWKWADLHGRTAGKAVYRYLFTHARPGESGAFHTVEIEYALGNLSLNRVYAWTESDRRVSEIMQGYFADFIRTGDPNGQGLPPWPAAKGADVLVMHIDTDTRAIRTQDRKRYLFLDSIYGGKP